MVTITTIPIAALLGSAGPYASPEPAPIVGGEPVVGEAWRSAVAVDLGVDLCTGTLISAHVVLTAAHCLVSSPPPELLRVVIGNARSAPELALPVARYALHPNFCADPFACEHDLHDYAYLELAAPAPADAVVPRLPTDQATWDATTYAGAPLTLVGFGHDERLEAGTKRAVAVELRGFTASGQEFFAGGDGKDGCHGDSGGPAYARGPDGEVVLVGVSSRGLACGEGGYFGAAPPALCWIGEELGLAWDPDDTVCGGCGCIDVTPPRADQGCAVGRVREGWCLAWALVLVLWRRRAPARDGESPPARSSLLARPSDRPAARQSLRSGPNEASLGLSRPPGAPLDTGGSTA